MLKENNKINIMDEIERGLDYFIPQDLYNEVCVDKEECIFYNGQEWTYKEIEQKYGKSKANELFDIIDTRIGFGNDRIDNEPEEEKADIIEDNNDPEYDVILPSNKLLQDRKFRNALPLYELMRLHQQTKRSVRFKDYTITNKELAELLGVSEISVKRHIKYLKEIGLIEEYIYKNKKENHFTYKFKSFKGYVTINNISLGKILNNNKDIAGELLSVYSYLKNRYRISQKTFTYTELISECLGKKSTSNSKDYEVLKQCLSILKNLGLIEFDEEYFKSNKRGANAKFEYSIIK